MNGSSRTFGLDLEEWMCGFVDVVDPKGCWGLILRWTDERIFKGCWAWSWITADEFIDVVDPKGRRCLILGWTGDERWTLSSRAVGVWSWIGGRSSRAVDLEGRFDEERRELSWSFGICLGALEFQSFKVLVWCQLVLLIQRAVGGLILNWWKFFKGCWGLILKEDLKNNEESSLDPSEFAWEL